MRLKQLVKQVQKWIHIIAQVNKILAVVTFCVMGLLTTCDVVGRYVFHHSITGTYEIVEVLMMVVVYAIFAYVAEVDANIRVDVLFIRFSKRAQAGLDIFSSLASIFIMVLITWRLAHLVWTAYLSGEFVRGSLQWPLWPFATFATFGSGILILELIVWFASSIKVASLKS